MVPFSLGFVCVALLVCLCSVDKSIDLLDLKALLQLFWVRGEILAPWGHLRVGHNTILN